MTSRRPLTILFLLALLVVVAAVLSLGVGRFHIAPSRVLQILGAPLHPPAKPIGAAEASVIEVIRLPRVLLALLSGAALSLSGAVLQGVFRNPLVGPHVLGVSAGAAFGGVLAIFMGGASLAILAGATGFGLAALIIVWFLASLVASGGTLVIVLCGMIVAGLFSALVSLLQFLSDVQDQLPAIVFWLLGSFADANWNKVWLLGIPVVICGALAIALRWRLNILSMGDEDARALGVPVAGLRWTLLVATSVMVAAQVAASGMVGWIGLVVPHLARLILGPDHRALLPGSALLGGLFMLIIDDLARTLGSGEIPLSVLTALIGTPVFAGLLLARSTGLRNG